MKFKASKKELRDNYYSIISTGYANLQFLLKDFRPNSYCTRVEGWACDNYEIDNVLISTGYSPIKPQNTRCNYDLAKRYDDMARAIYNNCELKREDQKVQVMELAREFVKECVI